MEDSYHNSQNSVGKKRRDADLARLKRLYQSILICDSTSCSIDKDSAILHELKFVLVEEAFGLSVERHGKSDSVGFLEERFQIRLVVDWCAEGLLFHC